MVASRTQLAMRGVTAALVLACASLAIVANGTGAFRANPTVTTVLPAAAGPVHEQSPVQYKGVRVGTLTRVDANTTGARLTLQLDPARINDVPADVEVRLLPRTLFGDQFLDLTAAPCWPQTYSPRHCGGGKLAAGATLPADTSAATVQLYAVYTRMYQLLNVLQPAKLQVALSAVADALRGRGGQIGGMIDQASALVQQNRPMLDNLGGDLGTVAKLSDDLSASAPDVFHALDDAVDLSHLVAEKKQNINDLLSAGIGVTAQSQRFLDENAQRTIQLVRSADPIVDVLGSNPHAFSNAKNGIDVFLDGANRAFATGFFKIRMAATLDRPYPYTPADCPRYPGLAGKNCGRGGSAGPIGPVGSPQELEMMRQLAPLLPPGPGPQTAAPSPDVLGLLLGPMVRGSQVVTP